MVIFHSYVSLAEGTTIVAAFIPQRFRAPPGSRASMEETTASTRPGPVVRLTGRVAAEKKM